MWHRAVHRRAESIVVDCAYTYAIQTDRQTDAEGQRQTQRDTDRHRGTQTDRDRKRQTKTNRDKRRQTDRQIDSQACMHACRVAWMDGSIDGWMYHIHPS